MKTKFSIVLIVWISLLLAFFIIGIVFLKSLTHKIEEIPKNSINNSNNISVNQIKNSEKEILECPKKGEYQESGNSKWIDCMPKINQNMSKYCSKEYIGFISKNCKDIEIVY